MTAGFFLWSFRDGPRPQMRNRASGNLEIPDSRLRAFRNDADTSQKALRIDVDLSREIALGLGTTGKPFPHIGRKMDVAQRFHQQAEAEAALDHGKRSLGRAKHLDPSVDRGNGCEAARQ